MKDQKETHLIAIAVVEVSRGKEESKAQDTSASSGIFSRAPTKAYTDGWDAIWGKSEDKTTVAKKDLN